jgi:hypothetical protein
MKARLALVLAMLHPLSLSAADNSEIGQLRASYRAAIERATAPLTQLYLAELAKRRDLYATAKKLEAANLMQAEIDAVNKAIKAALAAKSPPPLEWFAGKTWLTDAQTKWNFTTDGKGNRVRGNEEVATFTWKLRDPGLIELSEQAAPSKPVKLTCLQLVTEKEGWFGPHPDKLVERLHRD